MDAQDAEMLTGAIRASPTQVEEPCVATAVVERVLASRSTVLILPSVSVVRPSCCTNCIDINWMSPPPFGSRTRKITRRHYAAEHRAEIAVIAFRMEPGSPRVQSRATYPPDTFISYRRRRYAGTAHSRRLHLTRRNVQLPSPLRFGPQTVPL